MERDRGERERERERERLRERERQRERQTERETERERDRERETAERERQRERETERQRCIRCLNPIFWPVAPKTMQSVFLFAMGQPRKRGAGFFPKASDALTLYSGL